MIVSRIFFASYCVLAASCLGAISTGTPGGPALLPWPSSVKPADGELHINQELSISSNDAGAESAQFFADELRAATGWAVPLKASGSGTIRVSLTVYSQQLRGFDRIHLAPGETKTVTIPIDAAESLWMLDKDMEKVVEQGDFEIQIGASSKDIKLKQTLTVVK
jgi:hypothetical protein